MVADPAGNVFFADGAGRIRRIDASTGLIATVAGNGSGAQGMESSAAGGGRAGNSCYATPIGDNGPATNATLDGPGAVGLTQSGNLVFSDFSGLPDPDGLSALALSIYSD